MAALKIEVDARSVKAGLRLAPRETSKAILRSLKRSTKSAHVRAARLVAKDLGLKVADAKKAITLREPTATRLEGQIRGTSKRIPLIKFGARGPEPSLGKGRGVTARIGGRRRRYPRAFIATMPGGRKRGVFKRRTRRRLPVVELHGPSAGRVLQQHARVVTLRGVQQFEKELRQRLGRVFQRLFR